MSPVDAAGAGDEPMAACFFHCEYAMKLSRPKPMKRRPRDRRMPAPRRVRLLLRRDGAVVRRKVPALFLHRVHREARL